MLVRIVLFVAVYILGYVLEVLGLFCVLFVFQGFTNFPGTMRDYTETAWFVYPLIPAVFATWKHDRIITRMKAMFKRK